MTGDKVQVKKTIPKQLIGKDLSSRSPADRKRIATMGGKANLNNPNTKLAAKLREMKKKGLTDDNSQWVYDMMTDSEYAATHILKFLKQVIDTSTDTKELNAAMKTVLDWNKMKHGTNENNRKTLNVSIVLTPEELQKETLRLLEE